MTETCVMCGREIPEGTQVCYACQEAYGQKTDVFMNDYQQLAMRTAPKAFVSDVDVLSNAALGLAGEAGEFADSVKKVMYQGHALSREHLIEEVGDLLWYCALAARGLRISLGDIADRNIQKLMKRYPDGFSAERSIHRDAPDNG